MSWLRGGTWEFALEGPGEELRPCLSPRGFHLGGFRFGVGVPGLGFHPYEVDSTAATAALADIERFFVAYPLWDRGAWGEKEVLHSEDPDLPDCPGDPESCHHVTIVDKRQWDKALRGLASLLEAYGPPVIEPHAVWGRLVPGDYYPNFSGIPITWLLAELGEIAEFVPKVRNARTDGEKRAVAREILAASRRVMREDMEVIPLLRDGLEFDARPLTLRAVLWLNLFAQADRTVRLACQHCGEAFEPERKRGPLPKYCAKHRTAKARDEVRRRVAPAMRRDSRSKLE